MSLALNYFETSQDTVATLFLFPRYEITENGQYLKVFTALKVTDDVWIIN